VEDQRSILKLHRPFSFKKIKGDKAIIFHNGKQVMIVSKRRYEKLMTAVGLGDACEMQLIMAKLTGHFKHGNER